MSKAIVAAIIIKNKKVLLVDNIKYGLRVEPPGGKLEENETVEEAIKRETWEELKLQVEPVKFLGIYQTVSPEGNFPVHMYLCEIVGGKPAVVEPEKINNFRWFTYSDLLKTKELVPNMVQALPALNKLLS